MNGTFNGQILVEKLAKLNSSQQSIETLSHWCIFHRSKAKQVVETWARQFHCSPREQRLSYLYLANDILQNSRRKGPEFVGEFWKVLPDALRDVFEKGDEFEKNAALRLVGIWEERKVFGSQGKILKEELTGRNSEKNNRNGKTFGEKTKQHFGDIVDKIVSSYEVVNDGSVDEEALLSKCRTAVAFVAKVEKEIGSDNSSGKFNESECAELQGQRDVLRKSIEQLTAAESSRATLVSHLREALQEQEIKLTQVSNQLKDAQARSEQLENVCRKFENGSMLTEQRPNEATTLSEMHSSFTRETQIPSNEKEKTVPVMYTPQRLTFPINAPTIEEDNRKSAAAAVAAKLAASSSSAQMLSLVLNSLAASEGIITNQLNDSSAEYQPEKRPKIENHLPSSYSQSFTPPLPPFPHPESLQHQPAVTQPPPSSSSMSGEPVLAPPGHFMQTAGSMTSVPYSYGLTPSKQQPPPPLSGCPMSGPQLTGMPPSYQSF